MDRISKIKRSWNMSRIRGKDTKPEIEVRSILHRMGYRFRLHVMVLPGSPDIVLPKYRTVIFVHGCFWHRHPGCKYAAVPKTNTYFWESKFRDNVERDRKSKEELEKAGWRVIVIWECKLKEKEKLKEYLKKELQLS